MSGTRTITFDFYGTLVQWHEGVEAAFRAIVTRHGQPAMDLAPLIHAFHAEGRRLRDTPPWRPYRNVLRESLRFALEGARLAMMDADVDGLIAGLSRLPAHADVPAALVGPASRRLAARGDLQHRRRSDRGQPAQPGTCARCRDHRAAGPCLQAGPAAVPSRPQGAGRDADRRRCMSRRASRSTWRCARRSASAPIG